MKKWLRKISLFLILVIVFACGTFFIACENNDNPDGNNTDIDNPGGDNNGDDEEDNTPNIDQLSYYTLPNGFYLRLKNDEGFVANFARVDNQFFTDSLIGDDYSAEYLAANTDGTFTKYIYSGGDWMSDGDTLNASEADISAYFMFNLILHRGSNYTDDTIFVDGQSVQCDTYTNSRGKQYWLAKGYDFWIKNTNGFYATAIDLSLNSMPDDLDLPDNN